MSAGPSHRQRSFQSRDNGFQIGSISSDPRCGNSASGEGNGGVPLLFALDSAVKGRLVMGDGIVRTTDDQGPIGQPRMSPRPGGRCSICNPHRLPGQFGYVVQTTVEPGSGGRHDEDIRAPIAQHRTGFDQGIRPGQHIPAEPHERPGGHRVDDVCRQLG